MSIPTSRYGRVFDLLPEMIFVLDDDKKILDHNKAASAQTGFTPERLDAMTVDDLLPAEERSSVARLLLSDATVRRMETRFVRANGETFEASIDIKVMRSASGSYQILVVRDITEEKKKELDLLRFSNVIHHTVNPIQITDSKGVMIYVNPAFERTSGYSKEELIGRNPNILNSRKHSKEFWKDVWEEILTGKMWVGEIENRRKDGTTFHTELVISPIVDADRRVVGFMGAHRDLTEQKALERQLVRSQKMESIGTLAAGIAHEVGNPLTSISSLVQVILRTTQDEFAKEKLELIKNQINRITRIIRDLVDFSRPSNYVVKPTDVNEVLRDGLNIVQYGKKVKHITFDIELGSPMPKLEVVPDQLVQVFINILMNAVDALEHIPGSITIRTAHQDHEVRILVKDTGKGIDPDDREKIFEPFFSTKEVGKGTGLGLWVSYGIVKNFDGDIVVNSEPGQGSEFLITLPVKG